MKKILSLFLAFLKIGAFTFGGGYAMISLVENEFVEKRKTITSEEFVEMIAIAESTPGPIAINMATYVGKKTAGFLGAFFATLGVILPSFIIIYVISLFLGNLLQYNIVQKAFKGIACAVAVIILFAGIKLLKTFKKTWVYLALFILSIIIMALSELKILDFSFITVIMILFGGLIGLLTLIEPQKSKQKNIKIDSENQIIVKDGENDDTDLT